MFSDKSVMIFDMDGTLIDSIGIWTAVDERLIARIRGDGARDTDDIPSMRSRVLNSSLSSENPYMAYCAYLKTRYKAEQPVEEIHRIRYAIAHEMLEAEVDYKPNAHLFLKRLRQKGFTMVLASSTEGKNLHVYRTKNRNIMSKAPIDEVFSLVLTRNDVKKIKPDPEVYLKVLDILQVQPERCLVFEDSLAGVQAAKAAGLQCAVIYDKYSDGDREQINSLADCCFDSYEELLSAFPL